MSELLKSHNGDYFKSDSGKIVEIDECTYLRADTCTPNEECVSKAELEKFDGWLDNLLDSDDDGSQEDTLWLDGYDAGVRDAQRKLREVMTK